MDLTSYFQYVSLTAVVIALFFTFRQNQQISKQTHETSRQTSTVLASLQQNAYHAMVTHPTALRVSFLKDDPHLLAWHLKTRGFPSASPQDNVRRLYTLVKFDMHELNFVSYNNGLLTEDLWIGWRTVLETDFADPGFRDSWQLAKRLYAPSFTRFVDGVIAAQSQPRPVPEASGSAVVEPR